MKFRRTETGVMAMAVAAAITRPAWSLPLRGQVLDADTGEPVPARVYVQDEHGGWHFVSSAEQHGSAVRYDKQARVNPASIECHTTISAHPFVADLPPGRYTITAERGKECFPATQTVRLSQEPVTSTLRLRRWVNMAARGWYSGDTHVHRGLDELPNVQLAEDVNVTFPLLYWESAAFRSPLHNHRAPKTPPPPDVIAIDSTHVIYPLNTEYEIGSVNGRRHSLGAFFVIGHRTPFEQGVPPLRPVAENAHRQGALLELDKHNWPWSMALIPIMDVDLYELSNNHLWRTAFGFRSFGLREPECMQVERDENGWTEQGWVAYGLQNYYALLNCGFRLRPTAGTASGVHPVPLGFGRAYVHLDGPFGYAAWLAGLNAGRSFVTTGPMLFATIDGQDPGHTFRASDGSGQKHRLAVTVVSPHPLQRLEVVSEGRVLHQLAVTNEGTVDGAFENHVETTLDADRSTWFAVRCFEDHPDGRVRFAHTAPWFIDIAHRALQPRRREVQFLIDRVAAEIARSQGILPDEAIEEYGQALHRYRRLMDLAR